MGQTGFRVPGVELLPASTRMAFRAAGPALSVARQRPPPPGAPPTAQTRPSHRPQALGGAPSPPPLGSAGSLLASLEGAGRRPAAAAGVGECVP